MRELQSGLLAKANYIVVTHDETHGLSAAGYITRAEAVAGMLRARGASFLIHAADGTHVQLAIMPRPE
jgi:hypothetical protein